MGCGRRSNRKGRSSIFVFQVYGRNRELRIRAGGTELVELTDEQAKQLVINAFSPAAGQTPFGGIRLRVDTSGNGGPLIRAYSTSEHNRRMIARHFGAMMMDLMYQILRPSP